MGIFPTPAKRVTRFLDVQAFEGETALMTGARMRSGLMCHVVTGCGASPVLLNSKGSNASLIARQEGWRELSDWLGKKKGGGVAKIETYSDLQFEKQNRFGLIKIRDMINKFGDAYLTAVQNRVSLHPLGCPTKAFLMVKVREAMSDKVVKKKV